MKFIDNKTLKVLLIFLVLTFSEVHSLTTEIKLLNKAKAKKLIDREPTEKISDPEMLKKRKNYDVVFEKDVGKDLPTDFRFKSYREGDATLSNAEILTAKPPTDDSEKEQEIYPWTAIAASEHRWGWWFWTIYHYPAVNAISGRNWGHWESARGRQDDFWEAVFDKPKKIDVIEINFITLPEYFQVFYKIDDNKSQFSVAAEDYHVGEYINKTTGKRTNVNLIPKTYAIVFHKPLYAKRVKIVMRKPFFSNYFSINKVRFFQKRSYILVKNELIDYCTNMCFFVNTNKYRENIPVESYPCLEILNLADNRELFIYYNDRSLRLANDQNKCIGFNGAKELVLKTCNDYEPTYAVDFKTDGTLYFHGYESECVYVDGSVHYSDNFVQQHTDIVVTSEGDLQTYKKENIKINGNNFWASTPGEKKVTVQILFGKFRNELNQVTYESKKVDVIKIEWSYYPKNFKIYTWKQGGSWIVKKVYKNLNNNFTEVNFTGEQFAGVMFVFEDGYLHKDLGNRIAYGITNIFIGSKSQKLKAGNCKNIDHKYKIFDFDNQAYRKVDRTNDYVNSINKLQNTFFTLRTKYLMILKDKIFIPQAQNKGKHMREILISTLKKLKQTILEKIKEFRFNVLKKIKNTEFFKIITDKKLRPLLFPEASSSKQIGTYDFPGRDCLGIKKAKKSSISGWYFIKPECASKPLRVFCDFSIKKDAVDIYVFNDDNDIPNPNINYLKISKPMEVRYQCARQGLYPIKLHNKKMVKRIAQVLKLLNYDLNMPQAIPLGYDYNCDLNNACTGFYKSLDDRQSTMINSYFRKSSGHKVEKKGRFAGLGFSDNPELQTYDLDSRTRLGALICSTNHFETDISDSLDKRVSCHTSVAGNGDLFPQNNDVLVSCPMDCDLFPSHVRGTGMYHATSSVCRAAMHSGVLGKQGGKIHVRVSGPQKEYKGSTKNGITSNDFNEEDNLPSFVVERYVPTCPIDFFKNDPNYGDSEVDNIEKESSFLETGVELVPNFTPSTSFVEELEEEEAFPDINKLTKDAMNNANAVMKKGIAGVNDMANQAAQQANNIKDKAMEYVNSATNKAAQMGTDVGNKINDFFSSGRNNNNNSINNNNENQDQSTDSRNIPAKNEDKKDSNKCAPNTDLGRKVLRSRREESDWTYFAKLKKYKDTFHLETENFNKALSWSKRSSPISTYKIKLLFSFVERFRNKLLKLIKKTIASANARIFRTGLIYRKLENHYYRLTEREDYKINYNDKEHLFKDEWKVFDFLNAKKVKSKWDEYTAEINNRSRAIGLMTRMDNPKFPGATYFELNRKRYYDFEMTIDILFKSIGVAGIAFRYRNPYNYYALIINRRKSYKEVVRMVNGEKHVIQRIEDGGILINSWHTVKIRTEADKFHIFIYDSEQSSRANSEKMIEFSDPVIASGTAAVFTNNLDAFFFDQFEIKAKPCWTPWRPREDISVITNTANVYSEQFKGQFNDNYEIVDPSEVKDGPSAWTMIVKPKDGEDLSIYQDSMIYDTSSMRLHSLVLLRNKFIHSGIIRVEFNAINDNGIVSVIFKYQRMQTETGPIESYYAFECVNAGDPKKNQFVLRRIENGLSKELKSISNSMDIEGQNKNVPLGYRAHVPQMIQIAVDGQRIVISISVNSRPFATLMTVEDDSLKLGMVGFGTFHCKAAFTTIELRPPIYNFAFEKVEDFVKNGATDLALNPYIMSSEVGKEDESGNGNGNASGSISITRRNGNDPVWKACVINNTTEKRDQYCKDRFSNEYKKKQCQASFCHTCCKSNVFWMHSNTSHQCLKMCHKATIGERHDDYNDVCMDSTNPDKNVYSYCQNKFVEAPIVRTCKYDMCNLCCVNINTLKRKRHSYDTIKSCFKGCSRKFHPTF